MKKKILYTLLLATLIPLLAASEQTVKNKYIFIRSYENPEKNKLIPYEEAGTITFPVSGDHFGMKAGGEEYDLDEFDYIILAKGKIILKDTDIIIDGDARTLYIDKEDEDFVDLPVESKSELPLWIKYHDEIQTNIVLDIERNDDGCDREIKLLFGYPGSTENSELSVRQIDGVFFDPEQPEAGGSFIGGKYYMGSDGARFSFKVHKDIEIEDIEIRQSVSEDGIERPLEGDSGIGLEVLPSPSDGLLTFIFGRNSGKTTDVGVDFSMGMNRYHLHFVSLEDGAELPETPKIQLESYSLHIDKNEEKSSWTIWQDENVLYGHTLAVKSQLPEWLDVTAGWCYITFAPDVNESGSPREADVLIGFDDIAGGKTVHVRQEAGIFFDPEQPEAGGKYFGRRYYMESGGGKFEFKVLKDTEIEDIEIRQSVSEDGIERPLEGDSGIGLEVLPSPSDGLLTFIFGGNSGKTTDIGVDFSMGVNRYHLHFVSLEEGAELPETPHLVLESDILHVDRDAQNISDQECRWWTVRYDGGLCYGHHPELKSDLPEWIEDCAVRDSWIDLKIKTNTTGVPREADLDFGFAGGGTEQTLHIRQEAGIFFDPEQPEAGGKYFERRYYMESAGCKFEFKVLKDIEIEDIEIRQGVSEDGIERPLEGNSGIGLEVLPSPSDGLLTFIFGRNSGKTTDIGVDFSMGMNRYHLHFVSLEEGAELPETPHLVLESDILHVDRDAQNISDQECRWWAVRYDGDLCYGHHPELKSDLPGWIEDCAVRDSWIDLKIKTNTTGAPREADLDFGFAGATEQTLHIRQEADAFITDAMQEPGYVIFEAGPKNYVQPDGDTFVFKFMKNAPFEIGPTRQIVGDPDERYLEGDERIPFDISVDREAGTVTYVIGKNNYIRTTIDTEFRIGSQPYGIRFEVMAPGMPSLADQKAALIDLYNQTDGPNWNDKANWLSDEPLADWYGVRVCGRYVTHIYLARNRLVGEVPNEALMTLIKTPVHFEISGNGLYGRLSDELQAMPEWNRNGLSVIFQSPYFSGQRRITNYKRNLRLGDEEVNYLFEEDGTAMIYDILATHRLTHIGLSEPDEFLANMQLSYPDKFQNIALHLPVFEDRASKQATVIKHPWWGRYVHLYKALYSNPITSVVGSNLLVDDKGYIVEIMYRDWSVPSSYYQGIVEETAREILGEPTEHEWFRYPDNSEIQDTRNDGKYKCLHKATTARGIDIVLMGDGFGAADNEEGARYEQLMNEAAESILSMEPLKSLSDRINIYMVHVVSQSLIVGDGNTALNYDDEKCREYAARIPEVDLQNVTIVNIANRLAWEGSSYCNMKSEGWAVAHICNGGVSPVMLHEVCGHGVGRFLDEYIVSGYYDNKVSQENYADFCAWLDAQHSVGIGLNVDYHSNPEEVYWSRMLADERYKGLAGMYQGAYRYPYDLWRSTENSLMGTANSAMSAVQRMIVYKRIMSLTEGPGWEFDYETFVEFDSKNR